MKNITVSIIVLLFSVTVVIAQPPTSKEQQDLEKQRQQLKKELADAQALLDKNKKSTKENLTTLTHINQKLNIQEKMINNINKEITLMDNNIYKSQKDINKLRLILDTLKQEYAKSMVYAYKNRSSSDFLNFIFSASSFNDAIKRVNYLKSYRSYREMQGENILRTHTLLRTRIDELNVSKRKKGDVLDVQSKEADALEKQQQEKNRIVTQLKAQGKELNGQIAAKKKQMSKVSNAIAAAIKRAIKEAAEEKRKRDALARANAPSSSTTTTTGKNKRVTEPAKKPEIDLLPTVEAVTLNANFERNKGNLPWPVGGGYIILHHGLNKLGDGVVVNSQGIAIGSDIGTPVKAVFDGEVILVNNYDDLQMVVIKHGRYFTGYCNLSGVNVKKGEAVKAGQVIGRVAANLDGVGEIDFKVSKEGNDVNPEVWLKGR